MLAGLCDYCASSHGISKCLRGSVLSDIISIFYDPRKVKWGWSISTVVDTAVHADVVWL